MYHRRLENGYDLPDPACEQCKQQQEHPAQDQQIFVKQSAQQKPGRVFRFVEFQDTTKSAAGFKSIYLAFQSKPGVTRQQKAPVVSLLLNFSSIHFLPSRASREGYQLNYSSPAHAGSSPKVNQC